MGNFQGGGNRNSSFRGGSGGGRPSFNQKKSWGDDRPRDMHKATCSECGNPCEVPFKPTGEKPVYCNSCFSAKRAEGDSHAPRQDFGSRGDRKPSGGRPSYQSTPRPIPAPSGGDDTKRQLSEISGKLDRLISSMEKLVGPSKATVVMPTPTVKVAPVVKAVPAVAPVKKTEAPKALVKPVAKKKPAIQAKKKK